MTSRTLIENGGIRFLDDKDFSEPIEQENERMSLDFIIEGFERNLNNLKRREVYVERMTNLKQVTNISEYNQMNLTTMQLDELDLLEKNLKYLYKTRQDNLS